MFHKIFRNIFQCLIIKTIDQYYVIDLLHSNDFDGSLTQKQFYQYLMDLSTLKSGENKFIMKDLF